MFRRPIKTIVRVNNANDNDRMGAAVQCFSKILDSNYAAGPDEPLLPRFKRVSGPFAGNCLLLDRQEIGILCQNCLISDINRRKATVRVPPLLIISGKTKYP